MLIQIPEGLQFFQMHEQSHDSFVYIMFVRMHYGSRCIIITAEIYIIYIAESLQLFQVSDQSLSVVDNERGKDHDKREYNTTDGYP